MLRNRASLNSNFSPAVIRSELHPVVSRCKCFAFVWIYKKVTADMKHIFHGIRAVNAQKGKHVRRNMVKAKLHYKHFYAKFN